MALNLFTSTGDASCIKLFEIRLDSSNLILRGNANEAPSVLVKGSVVLCLSQPFRISNIRLRLTGESWVGYVMNFDLDPSSTRSPKRISEKEQFLYRVWSFVSSSKTHSEILKPGNYEYAFEHVLAGDSPESIEGLRSGHVIYRLKATIDRGLFATNKYARKHLRVIRTFDRGSPDVVNQVIVESAWIDKLKYIITTPTRGHIFGTNLPVDFILIPLLKGLRVGKITIEVIEENILSAPKTRHKKKQERLVWTVAKDELEPVEDEIGYIDGYGEGYSINRSMPMPKSLAKCRQTTDAQGIRIKHTICVAVVLINPDGHCSELRCKLPIHIFISPNMPLNDQNELVNQGPQITQSDELGLQAPPVYEDHHLDQLYTDVDRTGFMTPGATSSFSTPFVRSRNPSRDNLANIDSTAAGEVSASLLQARLNTVQNQNNLRPDRAQTSMPSRTPSRPSSPRRRNTTSLAAQDHHSSDDDHDNNADSPNTSDYYGSSEAELGDHHDLRPLTRRDPSRGTSPSPPTITRENSQSPTPMHIEYVDIATLSKVPSYGTATQTPVRTAINTHLPTYHSVMGRASSPPPARPRQPSITRPRVACEM